MTDDPDRPQPASNSAALEAAVDRAALAAILDARGRGREASETLGQVLPLLEEILGSDHYEVGVALEALAGMSLKAGRAAEASALYARASLIFERTLGSANPRTVACRTNQRTAITGPGISGHGS